MAVRSTVSADISKHIIWINSTDFKSTIRVVKIHRILMRDWGYEDGFMIEEHSRGQGICLTVTDFNTIKEMREHYAYAKEDEKTEPTTPEDIAKAREYYSLYFDDLDEVA